MIRSFAAKNSTSAFLFLICLVVAIALAAPRAASFAAPVAGLVMTLFYAARGAWLTPRRGDLFFALAIPALAALSALWAIDPPFALERGGKLLPQIFFGALFIAAARDIEPHDISARFVSILMLVYIFATACIGLEIFWGMKIYRFVNDIPPDQGISIVMMNRSIVVAAATFLPLMLILRAGAVPLRSKILYAAGAVFALLFCLIQTESQSAQLFIILALFTALVFPVRLRAAWISLGALVCAMAVLAPWIAQFIFAALPQQSASDIHGIMQAASIPHRMQLWDFIARKALENPLYGQGIEATRYLKSDHVMSLLNADNMLHPHNAVLQLWVEFGIIGVMFGCALFVMLLMRLWCLPVLERRAGLGVLIAMLAVMSTGYGLWQSWQIGLILAVFALMTLAIRAGRTRTL